MPILMTEEKQNELYEQLVNAADVLDIEKAKDLLSQGVKPNNPIWEKQRKISYFS